MNLHLQNQDDLGMEITAECGQLMPDGTHVIFITNREY